MIAAIYAQEPNPGSAPKGIWLTLIGLGIELACSSPPPPSMGPNAPILSVCEAAQQPIGARIAVTGEFDGTDYALRPTTITLLSPELCSERLGGGVVFAEVANQDEMKKIANAQPRDQRRGRPGAVLTIEGDVTKVEDGRFVRLGRSVVR